MTGTIPETLSELSELTKLNLDGNLFNGTLPLGLVDIESLKEVSLHGNEITGVIDESLCQGKTILTSDCIEEVDCSCCTQCF